MSSSTVNTNPSSSLIKIGLKYNLAKDSCIKVDIHGGYTLHTSHVYKR